MTAETMRHLMTLVEDAGAPQSVASHLPNTNSLGRPIAAIPQALRNFWRWFGQSKIVDPQGRPLVVYHGTARDFDRFQAHDHAPVFRAEDGEELHRADSWDMGDDRTGMPHGYHYSALSDALTLGSDAALAHRQQDLARYADAPDTQRLLRDLRRVAGRKVTLTRELRPNNDGFWFTPETMYGFIQRATDLGDGANVMLVYLRIENPKYVNAAAIESAGRAYRIEKYRADGYDGVIFADDPHNLGRTGWDGATQIVAFDAGQIKSALGNRGGFDPATPRITESGSCSGIL